MTVASQDINQDIKNLSKLELSLLNQSLIDDFYMKRALELAVSGPMGCVSPNPYVGAVIVKNHQIIGEGYHAKSGEAHAEIHALNSAIKAGHDPAGATIYVSLEPCNHQGKTGPCTHALIAANIREVVYAIQDPNPLVSGCGHKYLEEAGILVRFGVCEAQARFINRIFIQQQIQTSQKNINLKRPYIILKAAMSLDGKLATQSYDSKWITGETARQKGHEFRTLCDAILIGKGTLLADNPSLTVRDVSKEQPIDLSVEHVQHVKHVKQPIRVVVLSDFSEISSDFLIFDTRVAPTWLIYPESSFIHPDLSASLIRQNVRLVPVLTIPVLTIPVLTAPVLTVPVILDCLSKQGVQSILVEGGPKIHSAFLDADCVDEYILFYGACFIGGRKAPSLWDESGVQSMSQARKITLISSEILDQNIFVHAMSLVNSNSNSNLQKQGGDSCSQD